VRHSNCYDQIDLLGKTSERENLLQKLKKIGDVEKREEDEDFLPTKICRKCFRKVTGLAKAVGDFRKLCSESKDTQYEDLENACLKRGRKACSRTHEPKKKRRQAVKAKAFTVRHFAKEENNTALRAGVRISLYSPTPEQHSGFAVSACDILPLSEILPSSTAAEENASSSEEQLQASEILKDAGLRNPEVSVLIVYINKVREKEEIPMYLPVHLDQGNPFGQLWK